MSSRYIYLSTDDNYNRVAEEHGVIVTFDPKPMAGDWNGEL